MNPCSMVHIHISKGSQALGLRINWGQRMVLANPCAPLESGKSLR
jgi:hypothetical protein